MKEKIYFVKKLENPDFSNLKYLNKNMIIQFHHKLTDSNPIIYFGAIKETVKNNLYLKGFSLVEPYKKKTGLENQIVLGKEYVDKNSFCECPLTKDISEKDKVYEFVSKVNIDYLRKIVNRKKQTFRIELYK